MTHSVDNLSGVEAANSQPLLGDKGDVFPERPYSMWNAPQTLKSDGAGSLLPLLLTGDLGQVIHLSEPQFPYL